MKIADNRIEIWPRSVPDYTGNSESARLGLLSLINVSSKDGWLEAANTAYPARIDSQIDLRGKVSDYTVIVDFEAAALSSNQQKQELTGQGACVAPGTVPAIMALAYYRDTAGNYVLQLSQEISGARYPFSISLAGGLTGRHIASASIDVGSASTKLSLYLDGVLIGSTTVSGIPTGIAYPTFINFAIGDNRNGSWTNFFGKFYAAALFNRALPDSQINLISH